MSSVDSKHPDYPHHWDCQYPSGHPRNAEECIVRDGSGVRRTEIQNGGMYAAGYKPGFGITEIREVKAPVTKDS